MTILSTCQPDAASVKHVANALNLSTPRKWRPSFAEAVGWGAMGSRFCGNDGTAGEE
jgi:hypothetical protein